MRLSRAAMQAGSQSGRKRWEGSGEGLDLRNALVEAEGRRLFVGLRRLPHQVRAQDPAGERQEALLAAYRYASGLSSRAIDCYRLHLPRPPRLHTIRRRSPTALGDPMDSTSQASSPLLATIETSMGELIVRLFEREAPRTVDVFAALANGSREWTHPRTGELQVNRPLYDGTVFHRVVPNFMVQAGDPFSHLEDGDASRIGAGGPGFWLEDELESPHRFDRPGRLAMANAGVNRNGSQWFITEVAAPHLTGRCTIFGEVVRGFERVPKIARAPAIDHRPVTPIVIRRIRVAREGG